MPEAGLVAAQDRGAASATFFPHLAKSGQFHRISDGAAQRMEFQIPDIGR